MTRVEVRVQAKQPYLLMGYKAPIVGTADEDWERLEQKLATPSSFPSLAAR